MKRQHNAAQWITRLYTFCAQRALLIVCVWVIVVAVSAVGASRLAPLLLSGSGDIPDSQSLHVDHILRSEFAGAASQLLVLTLRSQLLESDPQAEQALLRALEQRLGSNQFVKDATADDRMPDPRLRPQSGTGHDIVIALRAADVQEAEQAIPVLRLAIEPALRAAKGHYPDLEWAMTGRAALTYDLNRFNARDIARAEVRALPVTLAILLLAFGSLVAAGIPIALGAAVTTVALGLVYMAVQAVALSNLVQNVISMIGLAVGIDYSLFILNRYRQGDHLFATESPSSTSGQRRARALQDTLASAGTVVFYSGLTVMIGVGGLLTTPLMETRSIGVGGCLVVVVAVLAALTLLPALLSLLGPVALEWPRALSSRLQGNRERIRWGRWANAVMRHPVAGALVSLALLVALAWPGLQTRFGFPEAEFLPPELEFARGMEMLRGMNLKGLLSPVSIVLTDAQGGTALTTDRIPALLAFSERLQADKRVAVIQGPVNLRADMSPGDYRTLYANFDTAFRLLPAVREHFVSRDERRLLLLVYPSRDCTLEDTKALARQIPKWFSIPGMRVDLGGQPVYYNDFDVAVAGAYGRSIGFVLVVTCLVLLGIFRAPLVAFKAIVLNALSVLAGYGVVVHIFQQGHGSAWFGVVAPTGVVPLTIPLLMFCILFGLSMDYEVFLLSQARAAYQRTADNAASVREALIDTGSVITSAALIMVAVFGAFAFARVVMVQMLGVGLAVSVLIDATVIRCLLGPALMRVAGEWNWWPGIARR